MLDIIHSATFCNANVVRIFMGVKILFEMVTPLSLKKH